VKQEGWKSGKNTTAFENKVLSSPKKCTMPREDLQPLHHNHLLKKEFEHLGLDLEAVFHFTPLDLDLENRRLESLLDFVKRY